MPALTRTIQVLALLVAPVAASAPGLAQPSPGGTGQILASDDPLNEPAAPRLSQEAMEMAKQANESMARIFFWSAVGLLGGGVGIFLIKLLFNIVVVPFRQKAAQRRYFESRRSPLEKLAEQAEVLAQKHDGLAEAADLFEKAGANDRAAECAEQLGEQMRAARLWELSGHFDRAAQIHFKLGDPRSAAEVFRAAGAYQQAADAYRSAGDLDKAAGMLEQADRRMEAAQLYEELGNLHRAARIYEEAGDAGKAAQVLGRLAEQGLVATPGEAEHLASLLEKTGEKGQAAEYYALSGDLVRAIQILIGNGDVDRAAELYSGCSENLSEQILASIPYDSPTAPRYAQLFLKARDHIAAARAFESLGRYAEAAELYTRCGDYYQAGEMFSVMGDKNSAAQALERAGDHVRAAELFELLGKIGRAAVNYESACEVFRAGKLFYSLDDRERALALLQKVMPEQDEYFEASTLVSRLMLDRGFYEGAANRLREITTGVESNGRTVEAFYALGLTELRLGNAAAAIEALVKVADRDYQHRDAARLLAALRAGGVLAATALLPPAPEPERSPSLVGIPSVANPSESHPSTSQVVNVREDFRFLRTLPLFSDFSLEELRQIWQVTEVRSFRAQTTILEEGGVGPGLFVLQKGKVSISRLRTEGEWELNALREGEHFGEISLAAELPVTARVRAESEVELLFLPRKPLMELIDGNDGIGLKLYRAFTRTLAARLKATSDELLTKVGPTSFPHS